MTPDEGQPRENQGQHTAAVKSVPLLYPEGTPLEPHRLFTSIEEGVAGGGGRESRSSLGKAPGPRMGPPNLLVGSPTRLLLS